MSQKGRRYPLKSKEAKVIIRRASQRLKFDIEIIIGQRRNIEIVEAEWTRIYLVDGKPLLFEDKEVLLPTLLFFEALEKLPKIVVDMGAVPYVCKGADVMAPGIVRIEGDFGEEELVVVADVKYGKLLSLGQSMLDSTMARTAKQGPVVKNLHYVSDKFWQLAKSISGD